MITILSLLFSACFNLRKGSNRPVQTERLNSPSVGSPRGASFLSEERLTDGPTRLPLNKERVDLCML